jgi:hypothetical protein
MSEQAARSKKNQPPPIDPALQSKLTAKFGAKLMKRGFTALPVIVQEYYRHVPGNVLKVGEEVNIFTGEVEEIYDVTYMTPTEYSIMTAIWSWWWLHQSNPWPSVEHICDHIKKSERQVRRYLQRMRDKGFMLSIEQYNGEGKQISNLYDFTPFLKRLIAYLDEIEQPVQPSQNTAKDDTSDKERMTSLAGSGCQNDQAKQIESETDTSKEEDSSSSGSAASQKGTVLPPSPTYSHLPHPTIRSTKEGTNTATNIESDQTSNRTPTSQELGAARRAKGVNVDEKGEKGAKFETSKEMAAAAAGIPREHLERLEQDSRKRPDVPFFIEACLGQVSDQLNDAAPNSSISQANNLFTFYAEQVEDFGEEQFRKHLYAALRLANRLKDEETEIRHKDKANKMPSFFGAFKFSLRREYGVEPLKAGAKQKELIPDPVQEKPAPEVEEAPVDEQEEWSEAPLVQIARFSRPVRTPEQKAAREQYAKQVRSQLRNMGEHNSWDMMTDREHTCGCSLFDKDWKCVRCHPDYRWSEEARVLIDSILEH